PPEYVIRPQDTQENKEARLLLTLHDKKRHATFLKTYQYFINKYPKSDYDEIIRHLAAEVYSDLYKKEQKLSDLNAAKGIYTYLIEKYPDSVLTENTELLLAYNELEQKNGIETIR